MLVGLRNLRCGEVNERRQRNFNYEYRKYKVKILKSYTLRSAMLGRCKRIQVEVDRRGAVMAVILVVVVQSVVHCSVNPSR
jgi:hypothetical protein